MLDGFDQKLTPGLNVLIGGRGTGKSSVIELIRFCLGATSYTDSGQQHSNEHALGVLGDGKVVVTLNDGFQRFEMARTAQDDQPEANLADDSPFVISQSEIETIGLHSHSRLRLIDDFIQGGVARKSSEGPLVSKIRSSSAEIKSLLVEIDDIKEKTAAMPKLVAELNAAKNIGTEQRGMHEDIVAHRTVLGELTPQVAAAGVRAETITRVFERLAGWTQRFEALVENKPTIESWPTQAGNLDELADLRKREKVAYAKIIEGISQLREIALELERKKQTASTQRAGLENRARDVRQKIEEKQKGASAIDKRIGDLTQQVTVLKSLVDLKKERDFRLKQLVQQRSVLIDRLLKSRQDRTAERESVTEQLNEELSPVIRLTVTPLSQHREYISALSAALRGSGLRYGELADRIANLFTPQEIGYLAESREIATIASTLEITEERALRLCDALRADSASALFTVTVEDDVQVELMDGSDYKGIDFLSMGQRCTAILPIILCHKERVIVLDQPEDHLDNAFVVGTLIKAIIGRATGAQTIIATHNPNIPVLGDANRVIQLDSDGARCFANAAGPVNHRKIVDAITTIMEGGREAFLRRSDFYAMNQAHATKR